MKSIILSLAFCTLFNLSYSAQVHIQSVVGMEGGGQKGYQVFWTDSASGRSVNGVSDINGHCDLNITTPTDSGTLVGYVIGCNNQKFYKRLRYRWIIDTVGTSFGTCGPYRAHMLLGLANHRGANITVYADTIRKSTKNFVGSNNGQGGIGINMYLPNKAISVWAWIVDCKGDTVEHEYRFIDAYNNQSMNGVTYCTPWPSRNISISGKVSDGGVPKAGVYVNFWDSMIQKHASATTDAQGNYSLSLPVHTSISGTAEGWISDCQNNRKSIKLQHNGSVNNYSNQNFGFCDDYVIQISGEVKNLRGSNPTIYADTTPNFNPTFSAMVSRTGNKYNLYVKAVKEPQDVWIWMIDCKGDTIKTKVSGTITGPGAKHTFNMDYCKTPLSGNLISGTVYIDKKYDYLADSAKVLLIESNNGTLTAVDSTLTQRGYYSFTNPDISKEYLIKSYLPKSNYEYRTNFPTYSDSSLKWSGANKVLKQAGVQTRNVYYVKGFNSGGPGFIGGKVTQGANKNSGVGDPAKEAQIVLLQNGKMVRYAMSDQNGNFEIDDLPMGSYTISAEVPGLTASTMQINLTTNSLKEERVRASINNSGVTFWLEEVGVYEVSQNNEITIYPNPVDDELTIQFESIIDSGTIKIFDLRGKQELSYEVINSNNAIINTEELPIGTYIVMINAKERVITKRLIKK